MNVDMRIDNIHPSGDKMSVLGSTTTKQKLVSDKLLIKNRGGINFIHSKEIVVVAAEGNYATIHLIDGEQLFVAKTLKYYNDILSENMAFFRVHQSYLININFINRIDDNSKITISNYNETVPIARRRKRILLNRINQVCQPDHL